MKRVKRIPNNSLHLLTYNVMHFENFRGHTKDNPNPILQYVIDRNPDIICFQEFGTGGKLTLSLIKKALCATPHFFYLPSIGVALFSRYPFLFARKLAFKSQFNGAFAVKLDINGHKTTLINCHLESNKISDNEKKNYYCLTKTPSTNRFWSVTQMLFRKLTPAFKIRAVQSSTITKTLMKMKKNNPYILVCGDLNDTPISYAYRTVRGELNDAFVESGDGVYGMGISFHSHRFLVRIDYIFCSKNIKTYYTGLGKLTNSDHYPIETYFQFI